MATQQIERSQNQPPAQPGGGRKASLLRAVQRYWSLLSGVIDWPLRFIFGRDIFISYSRRDAGRYAPSLALALQSKRPKLSFYLDKWIAPPSGKLPRSLKRQATSQELAARANAQVDFDPEESLLLAGQAYNTANTLAAKDAVRHSLLTSRIRATLRADDGSDSGGEYVATTDAVFDPSGQFAATTYTNGVVKVWRAATGQLLATLTVPDAKQSLKILLALHFSPDAKQAAASLAVRPI